MDGGSFLGSQGRGSEKHEDGGEERKGPEDWSEGDSFGGSRIAIGKEQFIATREARQHVVRQRLVRVGVRPDGVHHAGVL